MYRVTFNSDFSATNKMHTLSLGMWIDACRVLDQAEQLHRTFFIPGAELIWRAPADVVESHSEIFVEVALPGVAPENIDLSFANGRLVVSGERAARFAGSSATIQRLELPYGRFECSIPLAPGRHTITRREFANGCLLLTIVKG